MYFVGDMMGTSVQQTMLPLSICCCLFGFYSFDVKDKSVEYPVIAYCLSLVALYFVTWSLNAITQLHQQPFDFHTVLYQGLDLVYMIMIVHYCVKYITGKRVLRDVYNNMNRSENCLQRIGVKVSRWRDTFESVTCGVAIVSMLIIFSNDATQRPEIQRAFYLFSGRYTACNILASWARGYSTNALLVHFVIMLCRIKRRLGFLSDALRKTEERRTAWSGGVTATDTDTEILLVYKCLCDAYSGVRQFFLGFCRLNVLSFVFMFPMFITYSVRHDSDVLRYFPMVLILLQLVPVALCVYIRRDFHTVQTAIVKLHWSNDDAKRFKRVKKLLSYCVHQDGKIDCGYFEMNADLLTIMFDFVMLFLFAMLL